MERVYIGREDLKENDIVVEIIDDMVYYISRIFKDKRYYLKSYIDIIDGDLFIYDDLTASVSESSIVAHATQDEIDWLEYCEQCGEYRPKVEALENYHVKEFIQQYLTEE